MIVRNLGDVVGGVHDVTGEGWNSRRLLTAPDGMGYTVTDTIVFAGAAMELEYHRHLEACYCLSGEGTVEDLATGKVHEIGPGTLYALNLHDRHRVTATTEMRLVCCFTPALTGTESHGSDGGY